MSNFIGQAKEYGSRQLKAITTARNSSSITFHQKLGMHLLGKPDENGVAVVRNYAGPGADRVVFMKDI